MSTQRENCDSQWAVVGALAVLAAILGAGLGYQVARDQAVIETSHEQQLQKP